MVIKLANDANQRKVRSMTSAAIKAKIKLGVFRSIVAENKQRK